jgi:hypothetical protein
MCGAESRMWDSFRAQLLLCVKLPIASSRQRIATFIFWLHGSKLPAESWSQLQQSKFSALRDMMHSPEKTPPSSHQQ